MARDTDRQFVSEAVRTRSAGRSERERRRMIPRNPGVRPTDTTPRKEKEHDMSDYHSETAFLDAWRRGIALAGPSWFGDGTGGGGETKRDLAPRFDDISPALGWLSSGEAAFLAAMYSFYNARTGGEMMRQLRINGLADVAARLDEPRCRVIADLLVSYAGW